MQVEQSEERGQGSGGMGRSMGVEPGSDERAENWRRLCSEAGSRYVGCKLSTFAISANHEVAARQAQVIDAVREYCATIEERCKAREGLVLYGPVGTGKDHLAFAVARAIVMQGGYVRWFRGQTFFGDLRDAMTEDRLEKRTLSELTWPQWIVISDPLPPAGNLTAYQTSMLFRVIDERYSAGRPTIVTINIADDAEADARLGAPVWDRMCHGSWKMQCKWGTHRQPAKVISFK